MLKGPPFGIEQDDVGAVNPLAGILGVDQLSPPAGSLDQILGNPAILNLAKTEQSRNLAPAPVTKDSGDVADLALIGRPGPAGGLGCV